MANLDPEDRLDTTEMIEILLRLTIKLILIRQAIHLPRSNKSYIIASRHPPIKILWFQSTLYFFETFLLGIVMTVRDGIVESPNYLKPGFYNALSKPIKSVRKAR